MVTSNIFEDMVLINLQSVQYQDDLVNFSCLFIFLFQPPVGTILIWCEAFYYLHVVSLQPLHC
uniref:Uncharacterized protein n=1 Tax=Arundo donax TaxID=35708 RepID=A0A0A9CJX2_ARUDO